MKVKKFLKRLFLTSLSLVIMFAVYSVAKRDITNKKIENEIVKEDTSLYLFLDKINLQKNLQLEGNLFKSDLSEIDIKMAFQPLDGTSVYYTNVEIGDTEEIEIKEANNYSGEIGNFTAEVKLSKLQEEVCYKIYLYYIGNYGQYTMYKNKYDTGLYLYDKEIYTYNPLTFNEPDILDGELREIINQGALCQYSQSGVWAYVYNSKVYYFFDTEKSTLSVEQTSASCKVFPLRTIFYSPFYIEYNFKLSDYVVYQDEKYLVTCCDISADQPIGYFQTELICADKETDMCGETVQVITYEQLKAKSSK